mgnify:CR=1 FL=1
MKKDFLEKYLFFLRDWDYLLRLFTIGANLHIWEIRQNRGYGEWNPPSSLPGKQNPRSGF